MRPTDSRKKLFVIIGLIFGSLAIIAVIITAVIQLTSKNEYGDGVKIQNFNQRVKNVSKELRDGAEAGLYNIVKKNVAEDINPSKIGDAFIRDDSNKQDYDKTNDIYSGKFIVDIESIKQSYLVQYTYIKDKDNAENLTNRVVISCVDKEDIKYESFKCEDFISQQTNKNDSIIQYLPFSNFSFRITADATAGDDNLILKVELRIPQSDLKGNLASKQSVVALYKNEVAKWIKSKNLIPSEYVFKYNYDDNGDVVSINDFDQHGNDEE